MGIYKSRKDGNWDCGRAIPFLGIFVSDFMYYVFGVCSGNASNGTNIFCERTDHRQPVNKAETENRAGILGRVMAQGRKNQLLELSMESSRSCPIQC